MITDLVQLLRRKGIEKSIGSIANRPSIQVPDETFVQGFDAIWDKLWGNLMPPLGRHTDIWARPAPKFPAAYLWDSSFISQAWKIWDPNVALRILKPFVEFQTSEGRMPHMVFLGRKVSELSNPPFIAWAVNSIADFYDLEEKDRDKQIQFDYFIQPIIQFIEWRRKQRFNEDYHTYFWLHSYESGIDNSPRFTSVDEKVDLGTGLLGAVDLNAEILLQLQSTMSLCKRTGQNGYIPQLKQFHNDLVTAVEKHLWDEQAGYYADIDFKSGTRRPIDTIASYFFLTADDLTPDHQQKLINRLQDPKKYNCQTPLPSVAHDSPMFIKDMWRGPIWINTAYLVVQGLHHQNEHEIAGDYAYRLSKSVYYTWKNTQNFYEFYDPDRYDLLELNRKKGNLYKAITLGRKPVKNFAGWTADVNALVIESVFGLRPKQGQWYIQPHIPQVWLDKKEPLILKMPAFKMTLEILPKDSYLDICGQKEEKIINFSIQNHERHLLFS